ncbi:MAG: hypothetical protein GC182_09040 [Rhodopseudomonas sp.]|nr:hypothetical protein [Rhodopseudomonas sp.]
MKASRSTLTNCLYSAATRYDEAAELMKESAGTERLSQIFIDQALEARVLAAAIEQSDTIMLEG